MEGQIAVAADGGDDNVGKRSLIAHRKDSLEQPLTLTGRYFSSWACTLSLSRSRAMA